MNWKKLIAFVTSSSLVGGLQGYITQPSQPFTFHTVGVPALATLGATLVALFTQSPHKDGQ